MIYLYGKAIRLRMIDVNSRELTAPGAVVFDFSTLTAFSTCPMLGALKHKAHFTTSPPDNTTRVLALEAGTLCHEYFAALRLHTYRRTSGYNHTLYLESLATSIKGEATRAMIVEREMMVDDKLAMYTGAVDRSIETDLAIFACAPVLETTDYYDDPFDKRRTLANIEASCIAYAARYMVNPHPVAVIKLPGVDDTLGVEVGFAIEIMFNEDENTKMYYIGRIDGVHVGENGLEGQENKTAGRIDSSWRMSFITSHQVTGYSLAIECMQNYIDGVDVEIAVDDDTVNLRDMAVLGVQIPQPKKSGEGTAHEYVPRSWPHIVRFIDWLVHIAGIADVSMIDDAAMYTHSCNRYFRSCEFIPYCTSTNEERAAMITDSFYINKWNPLENLQKGTDKQIGD